MLDTRCDRGTDRSFFTLCHREYLTGFGKRKQERRRFGLAMQKVKDRKARLAEREEVCVCICVYHSVLAGRRERGSVFCQCCLVGVAVR